ncbi:hypothetical protein HR060_14925 [Catenovulum sp. SM1970]|nr:hypothetical protein [Marinifaba aquimaris]NTS78143.1 hypothetical protein [Marinifaba aquimaris]
MKFDSESGEVKQNSFGDAFVKQLKGISYQGTELVTRFHEWTIERA